MKRELSLEEKVLKLLPIGEERRCKELIEDMSKVGIRNRICLERKLADLVNAKKVHRIIQESPRKVFYRQNEFWKLEQLSEELEEIMVPFSAPNVLASRLSSDKSIFISRSPSTMVERAKNLAENISRIVEKRDGDGLSRDTIQKIAESNFKQIVLMTLLENAFKIIRLEREPEFRNEEFYVDVDGFLKPKVLVDELVTSEEISKWRIGVLSKPNSSGK
jgi:hypothetical protein